MHATDCVSIVFPKHALTFNLIYVLIQAMVHLLQGRYSVDYTCTKAVDCRHRHLYPHQLPSGRSDYTSLDQAAYLNGSLTS